MRPPNYPNPLILIFKFGFLRPLDPLAPRWFHRGPWGKCPPERGVSMSYGRWERRSRDPDETRPRPDARARGLARRTEGIARGAKALNGSCGILSRPTLAAGIRNPAWFFRRASGKKKGLGGCPTKPLMNWWSQPGSNR